MDKIVVTATASTPVGQILASVAGLLIIATRPKILIEIVNTTGTVLRGIGSVLLSPFREHDAEPYSFRMQNIRQDWQERKRQEGEKERDQARKNRHDEDNDRDQEDDNDDNESDQGDDQNDGGDEESLNEWIRKVMKMMGKPNYILKSTFGTWIVYRNRYGHPSRIFFRTQKSLMGGGQATNKTVRQFIRERGLSNDDAGHLVARMFGGLAEDLNDNMVGMNPNFNRYDVYGKFESEIRDWINLVRDTYPNLDFKIVFDIEPRFIDGNETLHPNEFMYDVEFKVDGHSESLFSYTGILKCFCGFCQMCRGYY